MELPSLSSLGSLASIDPTNVGSLASGVGAAADSVSTAAQNIGAGIEQEYDFFTSPSKIIMVLLGLLLVAAGIFSFDKGREVIVSATKTAAAAAA